MQAWPAIASGEHVLISAPTGSGKTLAAFLWGIDRLAAGSEASAERGIKLVYVSPLKALSYDIDRNLRAPLRGIGTDLRVAVRTGDTPQRDRQAMLREPPDILITTPESLYLMLTSRAQELFSGAQWCIVDEIHAVAATKRGAHLALTLERLAGAAGRDVQRIGLSATQKPLEEIGRFLVGPSRTCRIVDTGVRKELDLQIQVPVESMAEPSGGVDLDPLAGGTEATRRSIWPAIYPELLKLIQDHRSTILFVNARRGAERLALRLNELAGSEIARAHHGSLAREERTVVEEMLKAGELPCLVATSSLELGIDMGAVDLVIQVESPKSVARGLQRIGRAGHSVGDVSRGRIFPKFRADLLECAVVAKRMRDGLIETTVVPRNALDVLAQQIVAIAAAADEQPVSVDELYALVTRTHSYAELSRGQLENVLDMLDGRYPSSEFAELRPRIVWDRITGVIRPRPGARQLAVTNAGTIPDRGLFAVTLPDGRRVGELDEEMVYEARPGQTFLLGATTWRIEEIGRDRVIVTPAPGLPGAVPFWRGDGVGRPRELGEAIGAFARWAVDVSPEVLESEYDLDQRAAVNLVEFLREQQLATRVVPSDRAIVIERFRDEIGDWRLCVLSPYGGRVHAAWGLALSARIRNELGLESDAIWSDDGIIVHLPDAEEPPGAELVLLEPDEVEDQVVAELSASALFGARFRENASRALLIPRARPGKRTPLWQQRLKSQSLLEVAKKYGEFPIVLETYRECLRDVLDVPGLVELLTKLHRRELQLVEVETATASPFASSLLFDYVATYMYEGDTPNAERRAAALSLDRDLLRELLGQEELRDLIDPGALAQVEEDLQCLSDRTRATGRDGLHDVLRRVGDLSASETSARVLDGLDAEQMLSDLEASRRAVRVRLAGEQRWIDAADAGLYRDALGVAPPGGLPDGVLGGRARRTGAAHAPVRGHPRSVHRRGRAVPLPGRSLGRARLARARRRAGPRRAPPGRLGARVVRPRGAAPPATGVAGGTAQGDRAGRPARAGSLPAGLAGRRPPPGLGCRDRPPARGARAAAGPGAARRGVGARRAAAPGRRLLAGLDGPAVRERRDRVDRRRRARPELGPGGAVLPRRRRAARRRRRPRRARRRPTAGARARARAAGRRRVLLHRPAGRRGARARGAPGGAVGSGLGGRGHQRRVRAAAGAAADARARPARARASRRAARRAGRFAARGARHRRRGPGSGPLVADRAAVRAGARSIRRARRRALGELLLERYGILTREQVLAEGLPGGFSAIYSELSAARDARHRAAGLLRRGARRRAVRAPGRGRAAARLARRRRRGAARAGGRRPGAAVRGGAAVAGTAGRGRARPARVAGAYVVLAGGEPILYLERGGRALQTLVDAGDDARSEPALAALVEHVRRGADQAPRRSSGSTAGAR